MRLSVANLKFSHKFLAIGVLPMLVLVMLAALVVRDDLAALRSAQREVAGIEPAAVVLHLIQATQRQQTQSLHTSRYDKPASVGRDLSCVCRIRKHPSRFGASS